MIVIANNTDLYYLVGGLSASVLLAIIFDWAKRKGTKQIRFRAARPLIPLELSKQRILRSHVEFYRKLSVEEQKRFESEVRYFLETTSIIGVNCELEELDEVLVAAGGVIPIFGFPGWKYDNLQEVILYPNAFDLNFKQTGSGRNILGMVGTGYMRNKMILSQAALRHGFADSSDRKNVSIHEFVHLIDMSDGLVDGLPQKVIDEPYVLPWLKLMHEKTEEILDSRSDINPYGATNRQEFFAVAAEYFFERPELLKKKHPRLYNALSSFFRQEPATQFTRRRKRNPDRRKSGNRASRKRM